ncbi:RNA polymerase sigma factor [Psychroserpens algicola]|uniref:Sigma-70 family RNA polymerase sigma factor n=1 Tax=Psychroserpens algicola TaxID=1719034 RepID=A0ABT0H6G9_9FLAO|nr:sigma-70 family RNA polymerase sigma factor [Psychroserpens algicola]MCK8479772.1 sigma-70 family RNA polymerase sigma factor [Psychroserpens algicola]
MIDKTDNKKQLDALVDNLFRNQYGKMVSYLTNKFGYHFIEDAEDIVQETLFTAFQNWSFNGIPKNPEAWIFVVAKNKAINFLKKESKKSNIDIDLLIKETSTPEVNFKLEQEIEDGLLRMIFACCSLNLDHQSTITIILSTLCGFSRKELSKAFLCKEETVKKRLYRAKKKIKEKKIQTVILKGTNLEPRLDLVCNSLYLMFNEGYNSSTSEELIRKDICLEAIRLTKLLQNHFSHIGKVNALLSLMYLHAARFESRLDDNGAIILFKNQDRSKWSFDLIIEGIGFLNSSMKGEDLSSYHIEAGIAAEHCLADTYDKTNWEKINKLYSLLYNLKPSPIIELNLAIVDFKLGKVLTALEKLEDPILKSKLNNYYLYYATLGHLYLFIGNKEKSNFNFLLAKNLTDSVQEKEFIEKKIIAI